MENMALDNETKMRLALQKERAVIEKDFNRNKEGVAIFGFMGVFFTTIYKVPKGAQQEAKVIADGIKNALIDFRDNDKNASAYIDNTYLSNPFFLDAIVNDIVQQGFWHFLNKNGQRKAFSKCVGV